jgi:hypothetical protein
MATRRVCETGSTGIAMEGCLSEKIWFFVDLVAGRVEKRWTPALWVEQNGVV